MLRRLAAKGALPSATGAPPLAPIVFDADQLDDGVPYLLMERVSGVSLASALESAGSIPPLADYHEIAAALLAQLASLHRRGFVHGDVKPENVLIARGTDASAVPELPRISARLIDFGSCYYIGPNMDTHACMDAHGNMDAHASMDAHADNAAPQQWDTNRDVIHNPPVIATPEYAAPEILEGEHAGPASDVYAAGVMLFELVTLQLPFTGDLAAIEYGHKALRPPRPSGLAVVPPALERLILACLAKDPDRRPRNAEALTFELDRVLSGAVSAFATTATNTGPQSATETAGKRMDGQVADQRLEKSAAPAPAPAPLSAPQPVVLLAVAVEGSPPILEFARLIRSHRGMVVGPVRARMTPSTTAAGQPQWTLAAFSALHCDDPLGGAIAAAKQLATPESARVVLHLADLVIRPRAQGFPLIQGAEIEDAGRWLALDRDALLRATGPEDHGTGHAIHLKTDWALDLPASVGCRVHVTETMARQLARAAGTHDRAVPFIGHEAMRRAARTSLEHAIATRTPCLFTTLAGVGLGKSRIAHEWAVQISHAYPDAKIMTVRASRTRGHGGGESLWDMVLDAASDGAGREVGALAERLRAYADAASALMLIVDDAHLADRALLDAIEYATCDGGVPLWVAVLASPELESSRREWGARAYHHERHVLGPLSGEETHALTRALLAHVEYLPHDALTRLAHWSQGNPRYLCAMIDALERDGVIRQHRGGAWYLATPALDQLPPSPVGPWLAGRQLAELPAEVADLARICAVLGPSFHADEVAWLQEALERDGGLIGAQVDPRIGLAHLAARGVIERSPEGHYGFVNPLLKDGVYQLLAESLRQCLHHHALEYYQQHEMGGYRATLRAIAHHARGCRRNRLAAETFLALAEAERRGHQYIAADGHYTAALDELAACDGAPHRESVKARALLGRGAARYRLHQATEALEDLGTAERLATEHGHEATVAYALLEQASVFDWAEDFAQSKRCVDRARATAEHSRDRRLAARWCMAHGRSLFRAQRFEEAIVKLEQSAEDASTSGDVETHIVALLLLAPVLTFVQRFADAEPVFADAIALCDRHGDRFHLCVAQFNRTVLWTARGDSERAEHDFVAASTLARELGHPLIERAITFNRAEFLYICGLEREALTLAQRARSLYERFGDSDAALDVLLCARIFLSLGRHRHAQQQLAEIADESRHKTVSLRLLAHMVALSAIETVPDKTWSAAWEELVTEADGTVPGEEFIEILYWCARSAHAAGEKSLARRALARAQSLLADWPAWRTRMLALAADMDGPGSQ